MSSVKYTKEYKRVVIPRRKVRPPKTSSMRKFIPLILMGLGIVLLANVLVPLVSYEVFTAPGLRAGASENPVALPQVPRLIAKEYLFPTPKPTPVVVAEELDYTDLSNWFPEQELPIIAPQAAKKYTISIPSLNVENAEVVVGGKNLDEHLIQYPGTAEPGDFGAPVIFGHSVLRQFYNPNITNPRRYISIFSTIMTLKPGDLIIVSDDGVVYRYRVSTKTEVKPTDRFILEQQRSSRQLKLVTCVPEGTYLRRGVITAVLEEIEH